MLLNIGIAADKKIYLDISTDGQLYTDEPKYEKLSPERDVAVIVICSPTV